MKKVKIAFSLSALVLAVAFSAFTMKPTITAGWYAADNNEVNSGAGSYTYNSNNFGSEINPLSGQPSAGTSVGQCSTDESHVCAVNFNSSGNSTGTPYVVNGDYKFE
jgi:hypothetical protein